MNMNREILRIALPNIVSNITVPLMGIVSTAIAGHWGSDTAATIGALAIGVSIFNFIYWNCSFVRMGTSGLTAQAFGAGNFRECTNMLVRALLVAGGMGLLMPSAMMFVEQGGIYCVANLRGGSEYGEAWHKAGMLENKQNVFDDFIAAAEYLIAEKYTSSDKLAIAGGSNGGLLVGACEVQGPDLYAVCLPAVGVMDMLRYHKFTIGWGWAVEYGSSENEEQFDYIYKYSPLHNIREGVKYPATLVTTADHDDRVVPAHSFKFAAQMQHCQAGDAPVLIRIESNAGHGAGKPTSKRIAEEADTYSFLFQNIGVPYKEVKKQK